MHGLKTKREKKVKVSKGWVDVGWRKEGGDGRKWRRMRRKRRAETDFTIIMAEELVYLIN